MIGVGYSASMYPVVEIKCLERGVVQKADVLEYRPESIRVVVQGSDLTINLRRQGNVYIGRQAGLEFLCTTTFAEIDAQKRGRT